MRPAARFSLPHLLPALALVFPACASAQSPSPTTLDRVQVTATRAPQPGLAVPAAVSVVDASTLDAPARGVAMSEVLAFVPGVLARQRHNYAQDEQLSIRGFGTRSSFGIRGVRVYVDGIPATLPDGQGQLSHIHLATAGRVEVLRGPFSALYGNASGGVLQVFTADGAAPGSVGIETAAGADLRRTSVELEDATGASDYRIGATHFEVDGPRAHSRARRTSVNAKANAGIGGGQLTVVANVLEAPDALDPQGLTRAEFDADPRAASAGARAFNTRKSTRQRQIGAVYERDTRQGAQWRVLGYTGRRSIAQVLSIPVATQRNPLSGGGIIEFDAPYAGLDARWTARQSVGTGTLEWTVGTSVDRQTQRRRGYENFVEARLGERGALRLRQDDTVQAFDQYAQALWRPRDAWSLMAGVRRSEVAFESADRYVNAQNPDDSGRVRHRAVTPVLGANVRLAPGLHAYVAAGEGFETPTFNELGYRGDGGSGLNFALQPARTRSAEAGLKYARDTGLQAEGVVFRADTRDELAVATSAGGRTTFQNTGRARREGVEVAATLPLTAALAAQLMVTYVDARYRDAFLACDASPCTQPARAVAAGTRIPGVPATTAALALRWGGEIGWHLRADAQRVGAVPVNVIDRERADAYTVFNAGGGYGFEAQRVTGRVFATVSNLGDRRHAGSVIVNESNRRYYEPAPGRQWLLGMELRWRD